MPNLRHPARLSLLPVLLLILSACQTLGVPQAQTFNQKVLAAYSSVDGAVQLVTTLYAAGKISTEDAQKAHDRAVNLKDAIQLAEQVHATDPKAGADQLATAIAALTALQTELQKRQTP